MFCNMRAKRAHYWRESGKWHETRNTMDENSFLRSENLGLFRKYPVSRLARPGIFAFLFTNSYKTEHFLAVGDNNFLNK